MNSIDIPDYTEFTCTNIMIKLKILLKRKPTGESVEFYSNREQFDHIKKPFSKNPYRIKGIKVDNNKYHISILKN